MANYFVDPVNGDDANSGTDMDNAWKSLKTTGYNNSTLWLRTNATYTFSAEMAFATTGSAMAPSRIIGCPRAAFSITSATWTNGSATVDNVLPATLSKLKHCARMVTGPDGFDYFITKIVDSNTFIIDREYAGPTVSSTSGAATIKKDRYYDEFAAIDDSSWTIKINDWLSDTGELAQWNQGSYKFQNSNRGYKIFSNIYSYGTSVVAYPHNETCLYNMIMETSYGLAVYSNSSKLDQCVSNSKIQCGGGTFTNCAIYGCPANGFYSESRIAYLKNVNIGVEAANGSADIIIRRGTIIGIDVDCDLSSVTRSAMGEGLNETLPQFINIENYKKQVGNHIWVGYQGQCLKVDADGSGDIPSQRSGGAVELIEAKFDYSSSIVFADRWWKSALIFEHEFQVDDTSKDYRYYVQSMGALTSDNLWIEVEYVAEYDDDSEYVMKTVSSSDSVSARSDQDDWSQYIEVTGIQPATASKVRIKCYCNYYHATNKVYIDPKVSIS